MMRAHAKSRTYAQPYFIEIKGGATMTRMASILPVQSNTMGEGEAANLNVT